MVLLHKLGGFPFGSRLDNCNNDGMNEGIDKMEKILMQG